MRRRRGRLGGVAARFAEVAEQLVTQSKLGLPCGAFDFDAASAYALDLAFDEMYGPDGLAKGNDAWAPDEVKRRSIARHGAFFGELVRRLLDGTWVEASYQATAPYAVELALPNGVRCAPLSQALWRMQHGRPESFERCLRELSGKVGRPPGPTDVTGWLAQVAYFARMQRLVTRNPLVSQVEAPPGGSRVAAILVGQASDGNHLCGLGQFHLLANTGKPDFEVVELLHTPPDRSPPGSIP